MNFWSNIEVSADDPEIQRIDHFGKELGNLPENVRQIRELITRFEICHFKYQRHLQIISDSVSKLEPVTNTGKIGENHIHKGDEAWKNDKTGRSKIGQQYLRALRIWLGDAPGQKVPGPVKENSGNKIGEWLGVKNPEKERLVRLLIARLTWDWKTYEEFLSEGEHKDLEFQVCSIDICHYALPENLDSLLKGIGEMKAVENFEGCGSFDANRLTFIKKAFSVLNDSLEGLVTAGKSAKDELVRAWLVASLAKTLKEQVKLKKRLKSKLNLSDG